MKKISFRTIILTIAFFLSMFSLLLLNWISNTDIVAKVNIISLILLVVLFYKNIKITKKDIVLLFTLAAYVLINLVFTSQHKYFFQYFVMQTLIPFMSVIMVINLSKDKETLKKYIINPSFIIMNIYYFINVLVIFRQIQDPTFMLRNFTNNTFYIDHLDGFFGGNGTHKLAFFQLFCLFLNSLFFTDENKKKRIASKVLFVLVLITSCYVSVYNDNRMYFFLLIIFIAPMLKKFSFGRIKNKTIRINKKNILKTMIILISTIAIFFGLYFENSNFRNFIKEDLYEQYIERTINKVTGSIKENNNSSEERIELLEYAVNEGKIIGKGIGSVNTGTANNIKKHFALNDINIRVYTGGIVFALLMIYIYSHYYGTLFINKSLLMRIYLFITVLISAIYFQPFTYPVQTMIFSNVYLLMAMKLNEKQEKE